jgi:hypothetical protein
MNLTHILIFAATNVVYFFVGFKLGIKTERRDRKRRLAYIKKLLDGKV